jgi:hypothetical protein
VRTAAAIALSFCTLTARRPIATFNMADLHQCGNLLLWRHLFASQGYIVVAPNYAGYDTSTLPYHPYLIADQQSKDMIDALTAARTALPLASLTTVTRTTGSYSSPATRRVAIVAMATHRAMQAAGMKVTASAPMSGPYALAAFVDAVFYGEVNGDAPVSSVLLLGAYQHSYGTAIYYASADGGLRAAICESAFETLLPSTTPRSQLVCAGECCRNMRCSALTPPAPGFASHHAAARRLRILAAVFALGFRRRQSAAK